MIVNLSGHELNHVYGGESCSTAQSVGWVATGLSGLGALIAGFGAAISGSFVVGAPTSAYCGKCQTKDCIAWTGYGFHIAGTITSAFGVVVTGVGSILTGISTSMANNCTTP
jgi:hypothetical protein